MKNKYFGYLEKITHRGIQSTIMLTFSVISISLMLILGLVLEARFSVVYRGETVRSAQKLMEQTGESLEDYLIAMRQVSDAAYYNAIKEYDISGEIQDIQKSLNLLYEANKENLRSIALYDHYGSLITAEPVAAQKEDPNVTQQGWFVRAMEEVENMHFSTPHIQNLFHDATYRYYWVISLSRMVELTNGGDSVQGVLLVDMDFSGISRLMKKINDANSGEYYYLCDSSGEIIFHPRQTQLADGIGRENNRIAAAYKDGVYDEVFDGENRKVLVSTVSYTGWKLVGVLPEEMFAYGMVNLRYFLVMMLLLMAMMLVVLNRIVSVRISRPILKLNESVLEYEAGEKPGIYIGGSQEIRHLGYSIQKSYEQIEELMKTIVWEQNERRKSELDALQSQINPHFLYNALDSITWMIEDGQNDGAAYMVTQLARFFRLSLSRGYTVICVRDELQHAQTYMNIQKVRCKDSFTVRQEIEPEVEDYCAAKLILQPLLENAINYGVSGMDDGEITIIAKMDGDNVLLAVKDNGIGIPEEEAQLLLTDNNRVHKHGSGVGLVNVNQRIQLLFGKAYGLSIESEPDEGTVVSIRLPAIPFTEENRRRLENGYVFSREETRGKEESDEG
ncbi:sensor histidine kinase [Marvinbryantia formatexigens DSM 14469]|nr:sensor histidine kinase [Marvinbryantia formatexigens]UWO25864.1 sensor histidine kinase [Marvinbryantia formatexigens DSM 14469]SDF40635.1 two-component system, sensor histidine kinase YesM [Marvinbryantia formatexigens]